MVRGLIAPKMIEPPILDRGLVGACEGCLAALRRLDDLGKRAGVADREVGQDLPIELDVSGLETLDELAVRDAVGADGRVDADDPEPSELTLALLAVARRVGERVE